MVITSIAQAGIFDAVYKKNQAAIDTVRKGDFTLVFLDENNEPVPVDVTYNLKQHEFPWGTALAFNNDADDIWYKGVARKYFNHGVTENAFKWSLMQPYNGPVRYSTVDEYLDWCDEAGWEMRGHALLWGSTSYSDYHPLQKWVKDLPKENIDDTCKVRVQREMEYYKGRIKEYDVMNEAIPYHADYLQRTIGDSINWNCFKWAKETDPDARLFINDYNIITGANEHFKYMELIQGILDNGGPIDGIGLQSHFAGSVNTSTMTSVLDTLASLGLSIKITEFDMDVDANNVTEAKQAKDYAWAMRTAFAHPAVDAFLFWGFWDSRHWRGGAGMFNEDKTPKIAADSVYTLIHKIWHTEGDKVDCSTLDLNAYYGNYEVSISYNGETMVHNVNMSKLQEGDTLKIHLADGAYPAPHLVEGTVMSNTQIKLTFDQEVTLEEITNQSFSLYGNSSYTLSNVELDDVDHHILYLTTGSNLNVGERVFITYDPSTSSIVGDNDMSLEYLAHYEMTNNIPASLQDGSANLDIDIQYTQGSMTIDNNSGLNTFDIYSLQGTVVSSQSITAFDKNTYTLDLDQGVYLIRLRNTVTQEYYTEKFIIK